MIPRHNRFHGHNSLSYAYKQGRIARSAFCILKAAPNSRRQRYRVAVVVSKKVSKSAVIRNRIRRRVYAAVQGMVADESAFDLIFTVTNPQLAVIPEKQLKNTISQLLQTLAVGKTGE